MTAHSRAVDLFVQMQTVDPEHFNATIHGSDEMLLFDLPAFGQDRDRAAIHYLSQGQAIRDNLRQVMKWHAGGEFRRFLDFASGYGRLTRWLVQEMPAERVWISDIYREGVAFQEEQFGVHGVVSTAIPEQYPSIGTFDCIYVGSLFSHLPRKTFAGWLRKLYSMLTPDGLLAFSVLDFSRMPAKAVRPASGFAFCPASESATLDPNEYGTMHVTEAFVRQEIAAATGGAGHCLRIPRALAHHQDIYALSNAPLKCADELRFAHSPEGWVDRCEYTPAGQVELSGWSVDVNAGGSIREIQFGIDGEVVATARTASPRVDVATHLGLAPDTPCAWRCLLPAGVKADAILSVKAISHRGLERVLLIEPLTDIIVRLVRSSDHNTRHSTRIASDRRRGARPGVA